jgi:hypothetical protein
MSENPKESSQGYPEEQPGEVADEQGGASQDRPAQTGEGSDEATESGDGKATGNPRSAG